jgi:hypothetical protein
MRSNKKVLSFRQQFHTIKNLGKFIKDLSFYRKFNALSNEENRIKIGEA